ncbi:MAG: Ig-like domain-containing protein [Paludibacteraceae bacterium]|nr:Ig-like domain-containing protein [Paludibacteraceae bacterium]
MKKLLSILAALAVVTSLMAGDLTGKRIYVNPGHGSFGSNDRPMATIPYPNLSSTGMPDTCGFYETNTNLWKCLYLRDRLVQAGATVVMSREESGPWPYEKVNGQYPGYSWDDYQNRSDYTKYNKNLSVICEEVESGNYDLFISVHSNAANSDGENTNYPIWLYRGYDAAESQFEKDCKAFGAAMWPYRFEPMSAGYDYNNNFSSTNMNLRGDVNFMGSGSNSTRSNGKTYYGYYGVLKHGTVGGIFEGYFHTYQPARHRALNKDNCHMEGYCYYRGIIDYFKADKDTKGYILGLIKDEHEKIDHPLFHYAPKMHDQWLPLNGAKVTLYKGGVKIKEYTVDNNYNGVFYFGDLEPGNDYTLDATCDGYKAMWEEYKQPITVKANTVTYPRIYLENESWEEPKETYTDYPEPAIPDYVGIAGSYDMNQAFVEQSLDVLRGKTVHRVLVQDDTTMYVLAFDAEQKASLYLVNPTTKTVKQEIPTTGMQGSLRAVGDIALTADHVLVACNYSENQYDDNQVAGGNTKVRGIFRVYKWTDLSAAPVEICTSQYSANWYRGNIGNSMTVSGPIDDFTLVTTCPTISESGVMRLVNYSIANGQIASTFRNQDPNGDPALSLPVYGWDLQIKPSPLHEGSFILIGSKLGAREITFNGDAAVPTYVATTPFVANGATFFRYAKHVLMAVPEKAGVKLYDVTDGLDKAALITTKNTTIAEPTEGTYMVAAGAVKNTDISLYLFKDSTLTKFTTAGIEQPVVAHVNAYNLGLAYDEGTTTYTFSYTANSDAVATNIVFYQNGEEVGKVAVAAAKKGENSAQIAQADLPGFTGTPTTWAVELIGEAVANWGQLHGQAKDELGMSRIFNAIDNNPENATFQRIYLADYVRNSAQSGLYIVNPDYTLPSTTPMLGGNAMFGCLYRIALDAEGYVYMPDWTDGNSGVYIANPNDFSTFPNFFQFDSRNSAGVMSKGGVEVGSSTPAVNVYGKGKDTKLIVYNEDPGSTLVTNGLCIYNIGQEDGSIVRTWDKAPSKVLSIPGQLNSEGNVLGTDRGIWVSQNRTMGNNNTSATSLQFFDWDGNRKFSSAVDPYKDVILGSEGSAFALSADEKTLVLNGAEQNFYVFDIEWNEDTPVLTLRYSYVHGYGVNNNNAFRQLSFDYAGNLIATGDPGFYVFTMPTDKNITVVPAKSTLTVEKPFSGQVEGVLLSEKEATVIKGQTLTLTATVMPEAATNKNVTWATSNEAVATVADGVVTAVASGKATITVKTEEGDFTATCDVTVITPVTGVTLDKSEAALTKGQTLTLVATVAPAEADNKTIVWSSSNTAAATVTNGVVTAVASGKATITAKTEEGEFTATCAVTVTTPVTGVSLDKTELTLTEGDTETLTATVAPADADNKKVTWSTSNEAVATIADGVVTAVAPGEAIITAKTEEGDFTATCAVTVNKRIIHVTGVSLDQATLTFDLDNADALQATLTATVTPADATDKSITWESSAPTVASVVDGVVTALSVGEATITVTTTDGGFTATCAVTVEQHDGLYDIAIDGISYRDFTIYNTNSLSLIVFSAEGKMVATGSADISLQGMPSGTYLVRLPNGNVLKVLR